MASKLFDSYVSSRGNELSSKTIETYRNNYERFLKLVGRKKLVHNHSQQAIIDKLNEYDGDRISIIKTICLIYAFKKGSCNLLQEHKKKLIDEYNSSQHDRNKDLTDNLISYERLMKIVDEAKSKNLSDYVLFKLLVDVNCRNMDLVVKVVPKGEDDDDSINYMVVDGDDVKFVRNSYKTLKTHGVKTTDIVDQDMKKHIRDNLGKYLFETRNGRAYDNNEMGNHVLRRFRVYDKTCKLNQQNIFKILKRHVDETNDLQGAEKLCNNRGQNMETSIKYYRSVEPTTDDIDLDELD
jgi:uncharacterized protein YlzI (FlbEa/FlbD family)